MKLTGFPVLAITLVMGAAPAVAQGDLPAYARNVALHVLYHELAHALIDEFGLPILGNEEVMADTYATITIAGIYGTDADVIIADRARSHLYEASQGLARDNSLSGEHDPDARRAFRAVCTLYGTSPADFDEIVREFDLPEGDAVACGNDVPKIQDSWAGIGIPSGEGRVELIFGETPLTARVHDSGLFQEFVDLGVAGIAWPRPLTIHFDSCGDDTATYLQDEARLLFCSELMDRFIAQAKALQR